MAKISFRYNGASLGLRELNWGVTRLGRADDNDIKVDHSSISSHHCELELGLDFLAIRDCGSTNGSFIDGQRITEARIEPGQSLRLGDVEVTIERSLDAVSVPEIELKKQPASVVLGDGTESCVRHSDVRAVWRCTNCHGILCQACVHNVGLKGRAVHHLCSLCSHHVEIIDWNAGQSKKKSLWGYLKGVFEK